LADGSESAKSLPWTAKKRKSCKICIDAIATANNPRRVQVDRALSVHCLRADRAVFWPSINGTSAVVGAYQGPPDLPFRGYFQSSSGMTREACAKTLRRFPAFVAALAALTFGADPLVGSRTDAQTLGTRLDILMRSGERRGEYLFGWRGISADWVNADRRDLPRFDVRVVCSERCPSDLPQTEVAEDIAVWKNGPRTRGYIEVSCGEDEHCIVRQNAQSRPWDDVRYVQLRPSLGGCFARLGGNKLPRSRFGS
jgi:hypothetical protein